MLPRTFPWFFLACSLGLLFFLCSAKAVAFAPWGHEQALQEGELLFPRNPAFSPDGSQVAFGHQGDLFLANVATGQAHRLTAHDAWDGQPKWSPDGAWLAFQSTRYGNQDVFVLAIAGGAPKRITWHSEHESVHAWLDADRLLITTTRDRRYARRGTGAWIAYRDGRSPTLWVDSAVIRPTVLPQGEGILYERGHGDPKRRAYRGSASSALWVWEEATQRHRELTQFRGNDLHPMLTPKGDVLFLSDRSCPGNLAGRDLGLWTVPLSGGDPELVFHPGDASLRNPSLAADGTRVVAELGVGLVSIDVRKGKAHPLPLFGSFDPSLPEEEAHTVDGGASDLAISPDGESVAFVSAGDLYVLRNHEEIRRAQRITTSAAPDFNPVWVEDGKALLFLSERDGNGEVYRVRPLVADQEFYKARNFEMERLTHTELDESSLALSPDGKILAWVQGAGRLLLGDPATLEIHRALTDSFEAPDFVWSPDSQWLAWSQVDDDFNYDIFLAPADGSAGPFNLTHHPDDDTSPRWSPDGRKLAFTSRRQILDETDVWVAWLRKEDVEMTKRERLEAAEILAEEKKKEGKKEMDGEEKEKDGEEKEKDTAKSEEQENLEIEAVDPLQIDFEDIHLRLRRLTRFEGNERVLGWNTDSDTVYFNAAQGTRLTSGTEGNKGFYSVDLWEEETEKLSSTPVASWASSAKSVFYVQKGKIMAREKKETSLPFSVRVRLDRRALRMAVMEQAWRVLDRMFYDSKFHGHDWAASLRKWTPVAAAASTPEDFSFAMNWMLGEMNASHMGYYRGGKSEAKTTDSQSTGALGVIWDRNYLGSGRQVLEVLPGLPAQRDHSRLLPGEVVLAVNGRPMESHGNWARLLLGTAGQETELSVRGVDGALRQVLIRPTAWSAMAAALYRRSVSLSRSSVSASSSDRLGYIHIEGMGTSSLLEFERDLHRAAHGKEALLIDVRENGGGWTTDMVLAMLMVQDHAITIPRDGGPGYPQGRRVFATWDKPVVVLCNENSYSNAEIFSWAIQTLGRGPIVGKETYGAVISTGGLTLLDSSFVRVPFRGWFVNNPEHTNMEGNGCVPDYPVENLPGELAQGRDRQLEKAVEVALALLEEA